MAVLSMRFAATVTLGTSLSDLFLDSADRLLRPVLEKFTSKEHHKWIPLGISYACRTVCQA